MKTDWQLSILKTVDFLAGFGEHQTSSDFFEALVNFVPNLLDAQCVRVDLTTAGETEARLFSVNSAFPMKTGTRFSLVNTFHEAVLKQKYLIVSENIENQFSNDEWLLGSGFSACAGIVLGDQPTFWVFSIYSNTSWSDSALLLSLLKIIAMKASVVMKKMNDENNLLKQQQVFDAIFETTPVGLIITNRNGVIRKVNQVMARLFSYEKQDLENIKEELLFADEAPHLIATGLLEHAGSSESAELKVHLCRKRNGDIFQAEVFYAKIIDEKQQWSGNIGIFRDISEIQQLIEDSKAAREDAEAFKNKYSSLFERTLDGIYRSTHEGRFVDINPAMARMFGYESVSEMMNIDIRKDLYFDESDRRSLSLKSGREEIDVFRMRKKDGSEIWVEDHGLIIKNNQNEVEYHVGILRDVTDEFQYKQQLKAAVQEVEQSEKRYRELIEFAPDAFFQGDEQGNIIELNNKSISLTGYSRDELLRMNLRELFREKELNEKPLQYQKLSQGFTVINERELVCKDGSSRFVEMNSKLLPNGLPISFFRDITSRKKAELALIENEEKYRLVFNNAPLGIFHFDKNGIITDFNQVFVQILGSRKELLMGLDLLHQLRDKKLIAQVEKTLIEGSGYYEDLYVSVTSGKITPTIVHLNALRSADGSIVGGVGIVEDVSERKQQEEELIKLSRAVEQSPSSIVITDLNGSIEYVNKKFIELTGYEFSEVKGKKPSILKSGFNPEEIYHELWTSIRSGKSWTGEILNKKKNGDLFWESVLISPVVNNEGETKFFLAVKEDISEKKKMIEELIIAKEKAEESNRMKSAFLSTMSHELRTPLNAIIGLSELITHDQNIDKIIRYASTITSSGYQLLSVVNDVMDISLIESGEAKARKQHVAVVRLLFEVYEMFKVEQRRMKMGNLDFQLLIPNRNHDLVVYTDQNKLKQILINLLKNAFKFTDKGHVHFGYHIIKEQGVEMVRFYVEDTGIGISKDKHQLIFETFRQVEESNTRNYGGTGIGLSVSKKTTELLGGHIWVDSEKGKGSTFYFTIPSKLPEE
jgi:PAS domain S-box-containing protein